MTGRAHAGGAKNPKTLKILAGGGPLTTHGKAMCKSTPSPTACTSRAGMHTVLLTYARSFLAYRRWAAPHHTYIIRDASHGAF